VPRFLTRLKALPELRDVASDQQNAGLQAHLELDRATASRLGITPQMLDDALYDSFGQRQISTMFTQLNQYRVVLEVGPDFQKHPDNLQDVYLRSTEGGTVPLASFTNVRLQKRAPGGESPGPVPRGHRLLQPGAEDVRWVKRWRAIDAAKADLDMPASIQAEFQGTARAFQASLANQPLLILAAIVTVYILLGILYESYIHPVTILSTLALRGRGRAALAHAVSASTSR